jgi:hypothetical protein
VHNLVCFNVKKPTSLAQAKILDLCIKWAKPSLPLFNSIVENLYPPLLQCAYFHSWASASRLMPPASVFWHPESQSGTGAQVSLTAIRLSFSPNRQMRSEIKDDISFRHLDADIYEE